MVRQARHKQAGFALLFSVLLASILLSIGLSIFNITLKELAISTNTRQSIHAFYAADSGREYMLYLDLKLGEASTFVVADPLAPPKTEWRPAEGDVLPVDSTNQPNGPTYRVEITKQRNSGTDCKVDQAICTSVISYGYDSDNDDRLERAIEQDY